MTNALVFANGDVLDGPMVRRTLDAVDEPLIVAADGGARVAQHYGLHVDVVIGDMDSLSADELDTLAASGAEIVRYPPEKDATDLELALTYLSERGYCWLRIIGGLGDRLDQTIANVHLLMLPQLAECDVRLVAGRQEARLLHPGEYTLEGAPGDTVSLIPLSGAVHGITTHDLQYPLKNETLTFGPARGISNVMDSAPVRISFSEGLLLYIRTEGRA